MILDEQVISVVQANYIGGFEIELVFNDRTKQVVDFFPFLSISNNPMIKKYLTQEEFLKFKIDEGDLQWNDYDLCFPIADLYENQIIH